MNPLFLFLCWFDPVLGPSESHNRGRYVQHIQYSSAIDHVVPELAQPPRNRKKSHNHFAWLFASSWPIESWFCSPLGIIIPTYLMLGACMVWVHREADDVNQERHLPMRAFWTNLIQKNHLQGGISLSRNHSDPRSAPSIASTLRERRFQPKWPHLPLQTTTQTIIQPMMLQLCSLLTRTKSQSATTCLFISSLSNLGLHLGIFSSI